MLVYMNASKEHEIVEFVRAQRIPAQVCRVAEAAEAAGVASPDTVRRYVGKMHAAGKLKIETWGNSHVIIEVSQ